MLPLSLELAFVSAMILFNLIFKLRCVYFHLHFLLLGFRNHVTPKLVSFLQLLMLTSLVVSLSPPATLNASCSLVLAMSPDVNA